MRLRRKVAIVGSVAGVELLLYAKVARPWMMRWGATEDEATRSMPGDEWVPEPGFDTTKAITIDATPDTVWPWLAQMGRGRGGLYSFDVLDRAFGFLNAQSAREILPEYQHLAPGDVIPVGHGDFPVQSVDEGRSLVLAGDANGNRWTWQFGLYPQPEGTTRLVSRNRGTVRGLVPRLVLWIALEPAAFVMTRQMLLNLRRRAERTYGERIQHGETSVKESDD